MGLLVLAGGLVDLLTPVIASNTPKYSTVRPAHTAAVAKRSVSAAAQNPLPVTITNRELRFADSDWTKAVAAGTVFLALATFALAWYTRNLASETRASLVTANNALEAEKQARRDEERRHHDTFMPHLSIMLADQAVEHDLIGGGTTKQVMGREMYIENIGLGPALEVSAEHYPLASRDLYYATLPIAFAVNQKVRVVRGSPHSTEIGLTVEYRDVFRRRYRSVLRGDFNENVPYTWDRLEGEDGA